MEYQNIIGKCKQNRKGSYTIQIMFVEYLATDIAKSWYKILQQFANSYTESSPLYRANKVLNLWLELHFKEPYQYPLPPITSQQAPQLVKNLRREVYATMVYHNLTLITVTGRWRAFLEVMKRLSTIGLFPALDWKATAYRPYKETHSHVTRSQIRDGTLVDTKVIPKNLNIETDSYNTDVLVPLSIHLSDDVYLHNYAQKLNKSISIFYKCAEQELLKLKRCFNLGNSYIKSADYKVIQSLLAERRKNGTIKGPSGGYTDPKNGLHFFDCKENHPKLTRHLVSMVYYEMDGLPKPYRSRYTKVGSHHWKYIGIYGKKRLLPYLGILTARTAVPFIVLLLLENPNINVQSLLNAKLEDKYGNVLLFSEAGEDGKVLRITVEKPRANCQKHNLLSNKSMDVLQWLIKFTTPVRNYLRSIEHNEEAQWLWIGSIHPKNYEYGRLSIYQLTKNFQPLPCRIAKYNPKSHTPCFIQSHKELKPWLGAVSLKVLRVSKGVEVWFKSNGDPFYTARAFGHKNVQITLNNYIPQAIQTLMYERQIRRWQNLLICSASINKPYLLEITDFNTKEQLHEFLSTLILNSAPNQKDPTNDTLIKRIYSIIEPSYNKIENTITNVTKNIHQVLLINDPDRIAILLLYREKLLTTSTMQLDQFDHCTNSTPRMWLELGNTLSGTLLDAQWELRELVAKARSKVNELRGQFQFIFMEK